MPKTSNGNVWSGSSRVASLLAIVVALAAVPAGELSGQVSSSEFGARGGYDFDADAWTVGGHLRFPFFGTPILLVPGADAIFEDAGTGWQATGDAAIEIGGLYFGGGYTWLRRDFDGDDEFESETGLTAFVGIIGRRTNLRPRPAVELRWSFFDDVDDNPLRLTLAFNVSLR